MNILMVANQLPYPLVDASKKSVYYPIKHLAERGHRIHLVCPLGRDAEKDSEEVQKVCTLDGIVRTKGLRVGRLVSSIFKSTPYEISRFHNAEFMRKVRCVSRDGKFDILHVEGIHAAFYGLQIMEETGIPTVMRMQNVHWLNLERMTGNFKNPLLNAYLRYETPKVRRYESHQAGRFDRCLTISRQDTDLLLSRNPSARCSVVPLGVDLSQFIPGDDDTTPCSVLWMGALRWLPNQDSFWWFYREIVPRIVNRRPDVVIHVVGSNPPGSILKLRHPNVRMVGFVQDIRESLQRAQVCVVPLRAGSGVRLKLLEMLAMRKAVVSTSVGCEGLGLQHEEQLIIADTPDAFAGAVVRLLGDSGSRFRLGVNGQTFVRDHHSWENVVTQYEHVYLDVARGRGESAQETGVPDKWGGKGAITPPQLGSPD